MTKTAIEVTMPDVMEAVRKNIDARMWAVERAIQMGAVSNEVTALAAELLAFVTTQEPAK